MKKENQMGNSAHEQRMNNIDMYQAEWEYFDDCIKEKVPFIMIQRLDEIYSEIQYNYGHIPASQEVLDKIHEDIGKMYEAQLEFLRIPVEKSSFTPTDQSGKFTVRKVQEDFFSSELRSYLLQILKNGTVSRYETSKKYSSELKYVTSTEVGTNSQHWEYCKQNKYPYVGIYLEDDTFAQVEYDLFHCPAEQDTFDKIMDDLNNMYKASNNFLRIPDDKFSYIGGARNGIFRVRKEQAEFFAKELLRYLINILKMKKERSNGKIIK